MVVILVCVAMVLLALVLIARWGGRPFLAETYDGDSVPPGWTARTYARRLVIVVGTAWIAGITMAGAGGRLIMRLLAVTAGDDAQGLVTEAEQRVGEISVGGTIGLVMFSGLFSGLLAASLYVLLRRWLPAGWLGGTALGFGLLVVLAPLADPLRRDNPDFDIVGPGWLALATFSLLAIGQGLATVAVAARLSSAVPRWDGSKRAAAAHAPVLILLPAGPFALAALVGGLVASLVARSAAVVRAFRSERTLLVGRILLVLVVLAAAPRFVTTAVDIAGRGGSPLSPSER